MSQRLGRSAPTDNSGGWEHLLPVLDLSQGVPDPVALATWHMALSNLLAQEVPHELLGIWVFPVQGGAVLVGPDSLASDHVPVPAPDPVLTQDQLFDLEQILRAAKYQSAIGVAIRHQDRDVGLLLAGALEAGVYTPGRATSLRRLAKHLAPSFAALAQSITALPDQAAFDLPTSDEELPSALARIVVETATGPELVRRISGMLHPLLPHDRLEILAYANNNEAVIPLSGNVSRRRWGTPSSHWGDLSKLLVEHLGEEGTATIPDLAEAAPGLGWPGLAGHTPSRVTSLAATVLSLGTERIGLLVVGHAARALYRPADEAVLATASRLLAARVASLRLETDLQALRGQLEVLRAPTMPVLRAAEALASTAHLGEALRRVADAVRHIVPHEGSRYLLVLGDDELVDLEPDTIRPLADLPLFSLAESPVRGVLLEERPWLVSHHRDREWLAVPLRVAGRIVGAMVLTARQFTAAREAAAALQQFAAVVAPHLELLRRGALQQRKVRT